MIELLTPETPEIYEVDLPDFQGPLDLLLTLIEQEELDITKISLARVTDQYLAHLELIKETDPDELTDFLVIAARLILIKSEMLLPRPPAILLEENEEDVGDELARQLLIYKQFKEAAVHLRQLEERGWRSFVRLVPGPGRIRIEPKLVPGSGNLEMLVKAARNALAIKPEEPDVNEVISPEIVTIGQQMLQIWQALNRQEQITFQEILDRSHSKIEVIVTLLAILELIKRKIIRVEQPRHFGDIIIHKKENIPELPEAEWAQLVGLVEIS
jgi:segregation and condensation protein A